MAPIMLMLPSGLTINLTQLVATKLIKEQNGEDTLHICLRNLEWMKLDGSDARVFWMAIHKFEIQVNTFGV